MKRVLTAVSLAFAVLFGVGGAHAASDPLAGAWNFYAQGFAFLPVPGDPESGNCSAAGNVLGLVNDVSVSFRNGTLTISSMGVNIGRTNCGSPVFRGSGTYKIEDKGDGGFEASGTFSAQPGSQGGAACTAMSLTNASFAIVGKTGDGTMQISIAGLDSGTYAEGPRPGPTTCTVPIQNLSLAGYGKKLLNR